MSRKQRKAIRSTCMLSISALGRLCRSPITLAWIFSIAGLVVLTAMSVPKLRATQISTADLDVTFEDPPVWLDQSLLVELQDVARMQLAKTEVSRSGLIDTAETLAATGWFTEVTQVQWVNDTEAIVRANFLIPYAIVEDRESSSYIDVYGRKLPNRKGAIVKETYHFVKLTQPMFECPPRPGLQWNGGDILAALEVLKVIYNKPWVTQIQTINLSKWNSDGTLIFETNTPSILKWGSAPGQEQGLEALAKQKIERLTHIYTKYGRIDQGLEAEFDLTNTSAVIRN